MIVASTPKERLDALVAEAADVQTRLTRRDQGIREALGQDNPIRGDLLTASRLIDRLVDELRKERP